MKEASQSDRNLKELAVLFLKLGTIAFGGPAAHVAMMEDEVVKKRQWLTHTEFLDMLSATNFIPGPNSTEMAIHIGYKRAGIMGLIVGWKSFYFTCGDSRQLDCLGLCQVWFTSTGTSDSLWN